jgi:LPXTG-motif cell wall-anchored protein
MKPARTRAALVLALASAPLLMATTAHADTGCGTPAVPAVHDTIHTSAVSHVEKRWAHEVVDTAAVDAWDEPDVVVPATFRTVTVEDKAAYDEVVVDKEAWEEVVVDKEAWQEEVVAKVAYDEVVVDRAAYWETVVDQPAWSGYVVYQQAVYWKILEWRYKPIFQSARYELWPEGQRPSGSGWNLTGYWFWDVQVPERGGWEYHPEVNHPVHHPAVTHTVHHDVVMKTVQREAVTHTVEHEAVTHTLHHEAKTHDEQVVDVPEHTVPGAHHDAVAEVSHVDHQWAVEAPSAEWDDTGESRVVVTAEATDTQVLVTPGQPAGLACATAVADVGSTTDAAAGSVRDTAAATTGAASAVPVLAHTGTETGTLAVVGMGLVLVGAGVTVAARRRRD